jgi:hypothetical protein
MDFRPRLSRQSLKDWHRQHLSINFFRSRSYYNTLDRAYPCLTTPDYKSKIFSMSTERLISVDAGVEEEARHIRDALLFRRGAPLEVRQMASAIAVGAMVHLLRDASHGGNNPAAVLKQVEELRPDLRGDITGVLASARKVIAKETGLAPVGSHLQRTLRRRAA